MRDHTHILDGLLMRRGQKIRGTCRLIAFKEFTVAALESQNLVRVIRVSIFKIRRSVVYMVWTGKLPVIWLLQFIQYSLCRKCSIDKCIKSAKISLYYSIAFLEKLSMTQEEKYMKAAIREAKKAYALEEVPIGCVIVQNDRIIARGYNRRNTEGNTLAHAELTAIKKASKKTGDWRLKTAQCMSH